MFPGARDGPVDQAGYVVVGAPLERSPSFYPGTRFGPERIRHFGAGFEDFDQVTEQRFTELEVVDYGRVRPWADAEEYLAFLAGELGDVVESGAVPLLLGGEHTVSIAGVRASAPEVYVTVDAHLDLRTSFDGDPWSHATTVQHITERVQDTFVLGARAGSEEEWARAEQEDGISVVSPEDFDTWIDDELQERLDGRRTYLSIDIDGIDPAYAPATGTREPFGLDPGQVRRLIEAVASRTIGIDVVEVTDRDAGQTATLAAKLLRRFVYEHATHQ